MLENGVLAENVLLHNILPDLNFSFTCSNFEHPTSVNMEISVDNNDAQCLMYPIPKGVKMSPRVGTLSFTAWSFQKMFLDEESRRLIRFLTIKMFAHGSRDGFTRRSERIRQ